MKHRRITWAACIVGMTALGLSGIVAEGCGGDDNAAPGGTAGSGGAGGGTGGASTGGGGTGGTGGGTGGVKADGGGSDAPDASRATCTAILAAADSGATCVDACVCANCASEADACFTDPNCARLVQCAIRNGCTQSDLAAALVCVMTNCSAEYAEAGPPATAKAVAFSTCVGGAMCYAKCAPDGSSDAPTSDAPTSDAPASDGTTSDTTTTEGGGG